MVDTPVITAALAGMAAGSRQREAGCVAQQAPGRLEPHTEPRLRCKMNKQANKRKELKRETT